MPNTMLIDLINPQVMAAMAMETLMNSIRFKPIARVDTSLQGTPGNTLTLPKWGYIGDAVDVPEGTDIPLQKLTTTSRTVTVKKAGIGVTLTDEAMLSGYGDPRGAAARQIGEAIAQKIDTDCFASLNTIPGTMTSDQSAAGIITSKAIANALVKFGERIDETKMIFVSPLQLAQLRVDPDYINASDIATGILISGAVGMIWGCQVMLSTRIVAAATKFTSFIVKPDALAIYMKRTMQIETARNIVNKSTTLTGDQHYVTYLYDDSRAIKLITAAA